MRYVLIVDRADTMASMNTKYSMAAYVTCLLL